MNLPPAENEVPRSAALPAPKLWHVGTLTYTTGSLVVLFGWLLWGDFAWAFKERSVPLVMQLLLKKFTASDWLVGLLMGSLPSGLAMIFGPIIGYKSDRYRSRWGRRIPFLFATAPIATLSMVGLAFTPSVGQYLHGSMKGSHIGSNAPVLVLLGLFWTLFEFASIIANVVLGSLINDVVPQPVLGRFYAMFRALTLIAGMVFTFWILGKAEIYYFWIFLGMGALYAVGFTMMCLNVKEGAYPPEPPVDPASRAGSLGAAKNYLAECFGTTYYLWLYGNTALMSMAFVSVNLFAVFYAGSIRMNMGVYGKCLAATYLCSLVLSYPLGVLADRFHPLRVGLTVQACYAVLTLWAGLFIRDTLTFSIALVSHGILSGIWLTVTASLGQRLLPRTKFAQFASAMGSVASLGTMVIGPLTGLILDYTGHIYRHIYLVSSGLTLLALLAGLVLHHKFMMLGGPKHYLAPT